MSSIYVTPTGLVIPTVEDLIAATGAKLRAAIDQNLNIDPDSPDGAMIGIMCDLARDCWEVIDECYHGFDRDTAEGEQLDILGSITGTQREGPTKSTFFGSRALVLHTTGVVPAGAIVQSNVDPSIRFFTTQDSVPTTSAGIHTAYAEAEFGGPVAAAPNSITIIVTPVTGWTTVNNPTDPVIGADANDDPTLRIRETEELQAEGGGTYDGMRADVLALTLDDGSQPTLSCFIFENDEDFFDPVYGLPPHSFEVLTWEGEAPSSTNDQVAQIIWDNKPAGVKTVGNQSGNALAKDGTTKVVPFSRPVIMFDIVDVTYTIDLTKYAGDDAAKEALRKFIVNRDPGPGIIAFSGAISALLAVQGITSVQNVKLQFKGSAFGAGNTDLTIPARIGSAIQDVTTDITLHHN